MNRKYLEALHQAFEAGQISFAGETTALAAPSAFRAFLAKLRAKDWVLYAKPPFGGPEQVLAYTSAELEPAQSVAWGSGQGSKGGRPGPARLA